MKQRLINTLVIASVLATGAGLGLPGLVKWRTHSLTGWDAVVLAIAAIIFAYGAICGVRLISRPESPK